MYLYCIVHYTLHIYICSDRIYLLVIRSDEIKLLNLGLHMFWLPLHAYKHVLLIMNAFLNNSFLERHILSNFLRSSKQIRIQHIWWLFWILPTDFVIKIKLKCFTWIYNRFSVNDIKYLDVCSATQCHFSAAVCLKQL